MSSVILTEKAHECVEWLYLPQDKTALVRSCIAQYTKPEKAEDLFSWVIFRIKNAVASIFGLSVWQTTQKVVLDDVIERACSVSRNQFSGGYTYPNVADVLPRARSLIAGLFDVCLALNSKTFVPDDPEYISNYLKNYSVFTFLEKLKVFKR
jgi:hypothetical protein